MKKYLFILVCVFSINLGTTAEAATGTATTSTSTVHNATAVEARVRAVFADAPVMIEIARCESKFRQFTDSGNPLRGGAGRGMVGVFQFFESIHTAPAKALGFDLTTLEGNLGYARHVYDTQGTAPWNSARTCWDIPVTQIQTDATAATIARLQQKITVLQKLLLALQELEARRNA